MSGEAEELARLLSARGSGPVGRSGATRLLSAVAGSPLAAEMQVRDGQEDPGPCRRQLLEAGDSPLHERHGRLVDAAGDTVAGTSAWIVTERVPAPARLPLGISPSGVRLAPGKTIPLGTALSGLGVTREQGPVRLAVDPDSGLPAVISAALLRTRAGKPLAFVRETISARWIADRPPPWPV